MDMPYEAWADYVLAIWQRWGCSPNLVLDLACGTGGLTDILARRGYDMIGIDASPEMLTIARQKNTDVLFLQQDMREFELYGTVDGIICTCDGVNYIPEEDELAHVFALVANYLNPGGIFIFDINTEHKFSQVLADNTFAGLCEDAAYIWENFYDAEERINEYNLACFVEENGVYRRFDELHVQRAYDVDEIKTALATGGLEFLAAYHDLTFDEPKKDTQRIFFVAQLLK